jgi:predicted esterase
MVLSAQPPAAVAATAPTAQSLPITPGFHDLSFPAHLGGQARTMAYDICLPAGYDPGRRWPMLVYLVGVGDRGDDAGALFNNGPLLNLKTNPALRDWAPFIVFTPRCPVDMRWDSPGMAQSLVEMIRWARGSWAVDPDRVYLTGLSMGGTGTWRVALQAGDTFAAIAPFCAPAVEPQRMARALKGTTVCIICGEQDGGNTDGSRKMYDALHQAGIDVLYVEVPGEGHGVWPAFYASRQFYEFLLLHRRGQGIPLHRPMAEQLLAISKTRPDSADAGLAKPLQAFLPWWFVSNCGRANGPGLKDQALGRKNVFVTMPLDREVPCRLLYTTPIAKQKKTVLNLTVAAHPQGQWELVVLADNKQLLKRTIGSGVSAAPDRAEGSWVTLTVDLTALGGQQVHLELRNQSSGSPHPEAYWGQVQIVETGIADSR